MVGAGGVDMRQSIGRLALLCCLAAAHLAHAGLAAPPGSSKIGRGVICSSVAGRWNVPNGALVSYQSHGSPVRSAMDAVGLTRTHSMLAHLIYFDGYTENWVTQAAFRYKAKEGTDACGSSGPFVASSLGKSNPGAETINMGALYSYLWVNDGCDFLQYQNGQPNYYSTSGYGGALAADPDPRIADWAWMSMPYSTVSDTVTYNPCKTTCTPAGRGMSCTESCSSPCTYTAPVPRVSTGGWSCPCPRVCTGPRNTQCTWQCNAGTATYYKLYKASASGQNLPIFYKFGQMANYDSTPETSSGVGVICSEFVRRLQYWSGVRKTSGVGTPSVSIANAWNSQTVPHDLSAAAMTAVKNKVYQLCDDEVDGFEVVFGNIVNALACVLTLGYACDGCGSSKDTICTRASNQIASCITDWSTSCANSGAVNTRINDPNWKIKTYSPDMLGGWAPFSMDHSVWAHDGDHPISWSSAGRIYGCWNDFE
jgi:hypothetical protein